MIDRFHWRRALAAVRAEREKIERQRNCLRCAESSKLGHRHAIDCPLSR